MRYKCSYKTPREFSNIIITSDGEYLTGLFFENSKETQLNGLILKRKIYRFLKRQLSG